MAVVGVSVPHYWLGMVLVIVFSVQLGWLPSAGAGPGGSQAWELGAPQAPDPAGRHHVGDPDGHHHPHHPGAGRPISLTRNSCRPSRARAERATACSRMSSRTPPPTALAVMGLQLGYLLGGSILIETVFSWPGTGFLLNAAIFQRDLPLLQGTILVLAMFFVTLNLSVDVAASGARPAHRADADA